MKKTIQIMILTAGIVSLITACGNYEPLISYDGAATGSAVSGNSAKIVSGGAVSGQAVSGPSMQGQVIADEEKNSSAADMENKFAFCNRTDLYSYDEEYKDFVFEHRKIDGTYVEELKVKERGAFGLWLAYVDEDWLYYGRKYEMHDELWRAPIQKSKKGETVSMKQEEFLFREEEMNAIEVVDNLIFYTIKTGKEVFPMSEACFIYDCKKKKKRSIKLSGEIPKLFQSCDECWASGYIGNTMVWDICNYKDYIYNDDYEYYALFIQTIGSDKCRYLDSIRDYALVGNKLYYVTGDKSTPCINKFEDGKKEAETIFTKEQLQNLLMADEKIKNVTDVYADVKHLYIEVEAVVGKKVDTTIYFVCDIGQEKTTLRVERGLSDVLNKKYVGDIHFVDGNQCVFFLEDNYEHKSYDLRTGEVRNLDSKDPEYWWQYYTSSGGDYALAD